MSLRITLQRIAALAAAMFVMLIVLASVQTTAHAECGTYTIIITPGEALPPGMTITVKSKWGTSFSNDVIPPTTNPYSNPTTPASSFLSVTIVGATTTVGLNTVGYYAVPGGCIKFQAYRDANGCIVIEVGFISACP